MKYIYSLCVLSACMSLVACNGDKKQHSEDDHTNHPPKVSEMAQKKPATDKEHAQHHAEPPVRSITAHQDDITIFNAKVKPSIAGQSASSAAIILTNASDTDIEITEIATDVSQVTEIHTMEMNDSKMMMRKMEKVIIPAHGELNLADNDHVMLIDLLKPLAVGDNVNFEMTLSTGKIIEFSTQVQVADTADASSHDH